VKSTASVWFTAAGEIVQRTTKEMFFVQSTFMAMHGRMKTGMLYVVKASACPVLTLKIFIALPLKVEVQSRTGWVL